MWIGLTVGWLARDWYVPGTQIKHSVADPFEAPDSVTLFFFFFFDRCNATHQPTEFSIEGGNAKKRTHKDGDIERRFLFVLRAERILPSHRVCSLRDMDSETKTIVSFFI